MAPTMETLRQQHFARLEGQIDGLTTACAIVLTESRAAALRRIEARIEELKKMFNDK